ncbi:MAG TPA: hypothetical protein VFK70_01330 [Vicinamibacteria bacterium]|nr:hypothetical protein [Vicinamibacteria bacterium]
MTATDRERIQGLLAEGWRLLEAGDPREAALVFGRVVLVDPTSPDAVRGLGSARAAITESQRLSDERLHDARRALEKGDLTVARTALEAVIAEGGDRDRAAALLDRLDGRAGRLDRIDGPLVEAAPAPPPRTTAVSWSRRAFAAVSTIVLVVMGASVFSSWDRLLFGLTRPPAPRSDQAAAWPPPQTGGDRALAEARRLLEAGDAAAALATLDRVGPREAAYPFARQLRQQAYRALHGETAGAARAGHP